MAPRNPDGLIRFGMLALPLAGSLALAGLYSAFKLGSGGILATGDNRAIVSTGYFASVFLGDVLALTVLIFGIVALYAYLAETAQRTLALGATVSTLVGISLMLSRLGVFAYAVPALSASFLDGDPESITILDHVFAGPLGLVEIASDLLYSAGFVLFGAAIWRSGVLPRLAGVLVAVHAPLITGPAPVAGAAAGALLALLGGGWIALSAIRGGPGSDRIKSRARTRSA